MIKCLFLSAALMLSCSTIAFAWQPQNQGSSNRNNNISASQSAAVSNANNRLVNSGNSNNTNRNLNSSLSNASGNRTSTNVGGQQTIFKSQGSAPGLAGISGIPGANVCTTSAGVTGSGLMGGAGFSFPWSDGPCNRRSGALTLSSMGQKAAAVQMLCEDDDMAQALTATGVVCRVGRYARQH